jgi:aryl-alcohol dehydrogenase-like predicted oxidoreductase
MEQLTLGTTSLQVSRVGLGTVELGLPYEIGLPAPPDDGACIRLLRAAHDGGITFIDTAAAYGRSEELVGRAFADVTDRPVLATKVGLRVGKDAGPMSGRALHDHLEKSVASSLKALAVQQLDLLQIHSVNEGDFSEDLLESMSSLQDRGLVRYWGASTYGEAAPSTVLQHHELIRSLQVAYSVLDRRMGESVLPRCQELGVARIIRSVFLKGVLSDRARQLPAHLDGLRDAALKAGKVAHGLGISLPEMALRFVAFSSQADVTLFGTASLDEVEANLKTIADGPLPADALAALDGLHITDAELLNPSTWGF